MDTEDHTNIDFTKHARTVAGIIVAVPAGLLMWVFVAIAFLLLIAGCSKVRAQTTLYFKLAAA